LGAGTSPRGNYPFGVSLSQKILWNATLRANIAARHAEVLQELVQTLNRSAAVVVAKRRFLDWLHPGCLVHNAHRIEMRGDSVRKNRGKANA
jgi:hypothetical protein